MSTIKVWVLIIHLSYGGQNSGITVIDNIATEKECDRLGSLVIIDRNTRSVRCFEVKKVKGGAA